jgi:hypothetical protein
MRASWIGAPTASPRSRRARIQILLPYRKYWAFHNPVILGTALRPVGEIFRSTALWRERTSPRHPFVKEWWLLSGRGRGGVGRQFAGRRPVFGIDLRCQCAGQGRPTVEQTRVFEAALRHIIRAVRISRQFWALDFGPSTAPVGDLARRKPASGCYSHSRRVGQELRVCVSQMNVAPTATRAIRLDR